MDINPKALYKPYTRSEEHAVARYVFRMGVLNIVSSLIMDRWAGSHKDDSRGVASATFLTGFAAVAWLGAYGLREQNRKAAKQ